MQVGQGGYNWQQEHSNHRATLRCVLGLPYLSSGTLHETKNAYVSSKNAGSRVTIILLG